MIIEPKIGDRVIVLTPDNRLYVGTVNDYTESGYHWEIQGSAGWYPRTWKMTIEETDYEGKGWSQYKGKDLTFTREKGTDSKHYCIYTPELWEKIKTAKKNIYNAKWILWDLLEDDKPLKDLVKN